MYVGCRYRVENFPSPFLSIFTIFGPSKRLLTSSQTLLHYNVLAWEGKAYEVGLDYLRAQGLPVEGLKFNSDLVIRGLIVDKENGEENEHKHTLPGACSR